MRSPSGNAEILQVFADSLTDERLDLGLDHRKGHAVNAGRSRICAELRRLSDLSQASGVEGWLANLREELVSKTVVPVAN